VIFDTDILIGIQRKNEKAARSVNEADERLLSIYSYMELLQGAKDKKQLASSTAFLKDFEFRTLPLTEAIGNRAAIYIEDHALSHGLKAGDALIAATAVGHGKTLCTGNAKHFGMIKELKVKSLKAN